MKSYINRLNKAFSTSGILFVLPALLLVSSLIIYPVFSNIALSFTDKSLISQEFNFIGIKNYINILKNKSFYSSFFMSLKWTFFSISLQLIVGFALAIMLNHIKKCQGLLRSLLIIPWAFPSIVIALSWQWILNDIYGFLNNLLLALNIIDSPILFLANNKIVFWTILAINVWFGAPLMMVNILSALQTIPKDQYEAIQIDGANIFQTFTNITLRHIRTVIGLLLVLRTIWVFNNFEFVFLLTGGGPGTATETVAIYAYKTGWLLRQIGKSSAITMLLLVFLLVICFMYFKVLDKWEKEDIYE